MTTGVPGAAPHTHGPSDGTIGAIGLLVSVFWASFAVYALYGAVPLNPIHLPYTDRIGVRTLAPQGWAFFTRDPREERVFSFTRGGGEWRSASLAPHGRPSNAFGLNRVSRAQAVEEGMLMVTQSDSAWRPCHVDALTCLASAPSGGVVHNYSPEPTLCGDVGFALRRPIPWAWTQSGKDIVMPSRVMRLTVEC